MTTMRMKTILVPCPSAWDKLQLGTPACARQNEYRFVFAGAGAADRPEAFDVASFIEAAIAHHHVDPFDGVASSGDYPGAPVASAIADALGLPGPSPRAVLACSHKYYARVALQRAVPEATPRFAIVDPAALDGFEFTFPCFVKPVKSCFSVLARRMEGAADLRAFARSSEVAKHLFGTMRPFNELLRRYSDFTYDAGFLLAEKILEGDQVTVEGFVSHGRVRVLGIVDSVMYPGTIHFLRFDFPSRLPDAVQRRMVALTERVVAALALDDTMFNVELICHRETEEIHVIEVNPRMCGQFATLMESVIGTNTYDTLLALATGESSRVGRDRGRFSVASSFPLRSFVDARVAKVPDQECVWRVMRELPVTLVRTDYSRGQKLSDMEGNCVGGSYRYAVVNVAGNSRAEMLRDYEEARRRLGYRIEPCG